MSQDVLPETLTYPSHDGRTTIHALLWRPDAAESPRGIVQLVHGMAEHIARYDDFARFLAQHGYVVCGSDHVGHGQSVRDKSEWGCIDMAGGADTLIADVHELRQAVQPCFAEDVPYYIFGHSMGSFVVRNYIAAHGEGLRGAIICGTGHIPGPTARGGLALARIIAKLRGPSHKSALLDKLGTGAYNKSIDNPRTPVDWISRNTDNIDRYLADDACGFPFAASGYIALTDLTARLASGAWAQAVPKQLSLLYVSGSEDPVGDCGKGVRTAYDHARAAGITDVSIRIYEHMRHEILNEEEHMTVYNDILAWLEERNRS